MSPSALRRLRRLPGWVLWLAFVPLQVALAAEYRVVRAFPVAAEPACMPALTRAPNGDLLVAFSTVWEPFPAGGVLKLVVSKDGGRTWSQPRVLWNDPDPRVTIQVSNGLQTLSNGEVLLPVARCIVPRRQGVPAGEKHPVKLYDPGAPGFRREVRLFRSKDSGRSWGVEDPKLGASWWRFGRLLETGGRLIMSGEGWYIESHDFGRTWRRKTPLGVPYPSETNIAAAKNGELIYLHRHDGELGREFGPRRTFLTGSSSDGGRTWTKYRSAGVQGKMPDLLVLPSGRILLAVGAEGLSDGSQIFTRNERRSFCTLFISDDHGETWKRDLEFAAVPPAGTVVPADSPVLWPLEGGRILVVMQGIDRARAGEPLLGFSAGMSLIGNVIEPRNAP